MSNTLLSNVKAFEEIVDIILPCSADLHTNEKNMEAQTNHENPFNNQKQLDRDTHAGQSDPAMAGFGKSFHIVDVNSDLPFMKL